MSKQHNVTRRNFVQSAAAAGALAAATSLAGCNSGSSTSDPAQAPATDKYPIDAEKWGKGTVRHSEEVVGDERTYDGWTRVTNEGGTTLSIMDTGKLIQVDGYAFKDLNGNGKLDIFEDWRQPAVVRAEAWAKELEVDANLGLMLHSDCMAANLDLSKADARSMTVQEALDGGARTFLNFSTSNTPKDQAMFNNSLQRYAEALPGSLPVSISTNERHFGIFPGNLGLAASFDPTLAGSVARSISKMYRAIGVTTLLGPQIGLNTEPRWKRIMTGLGEDPALSRDMARALIDGYQSTYDENDEDQGWGTDSVVGMMKHFPGDGAAESGREAHYQYGEFNVYPGNNFQAHLVPFADGALSLDGKTEKSAACMPSYSIAWSDDGSMGELVGSAFSKYKIDLLRENCGYDGLVCTDFGVAEDMRAWGMLDKTEPERLAKIVEAGCDQFGGYAVASNLKEAYELLKKDLGEEAAEQRVRESGRRVLSTFLEVGLVDDPYVDTTVADDALGSEDVLALAKEAQGKTVVMLKNKGGVIKKSSGEKPTVYVPKRYTEFVAGEDGVEDTPSCWDLPFDEADLAEYMNVVTDSVAVALTGPTTSDGTVCPALADLVAPTADELAKCDFALVVVNSPATGVGYDEDTETYIPISLQYGEYVGDGANVREASIAGEDLSDGSRENRSYLGQKTVATNLNDLTVTQRTRELMGDKPVVLCVNADRPMCFGEIEPLADAILLGFVMDGTDLPVNAFCDLACGKVEPSGLLPLQMPLDMDVVEGQLEDVPRDMEVYADSEGNEYDFAFGLDWSGVISDERTQKYGVDPLTKPEKFTF